MTPPFVSNPTIMGEVYAAAVYNLAMEIKAKYVKTPKQRKLWKSVIDEHNQDWHYWLHGAGKSYVEKVRWALRHLDSESPFDLYCHIERGHGVLKSDLLRWAELYAYTYNTDEFLRDYTRGMMLYGLPRQESVERCYKYIVSLKEKYQYEV